MGSAEGFAILIHILGISLPGPKRKGVVQTYWAYEFSHLMLHQYNPLESLLKLCNISLP